MLDDRGFEEALEGVFEEHAPKFSGHLRQMLKALYREGVKEGRAQERETFDFDLSDSRKITGVDPAYPVVVTSTAVQWGELTVEKMKQLVEELEPVSRQYRQELHGTWVDDWVAEASPWKCPKETLPSSQRLSTPVRSRQSVIDSIILDGSGND